ncbi:MAG: putative toxin-antitoxin system toxin component, PIN family [Chloroflexi bacterium]|nr:putative toxin-antitoxin system toxin component, PIN family [Chloroflexota bacterium]
MLRAVIDTNVVVSAAISASGSPRRIVNSALRGFFVALTSDPLLAEFEDVATRAHGIGKYPGLLRQSSRISVFLSVWSVGDPTRLNQTIVREHPADDRVLECAVAGKADYVVSGDRHLLALREFQGIPIVTPTEFLGVLKRAR